MAIRGMVPHQPITPNPLTGLASVANSWGACRHEERTKDT